MTLPLVVQERPTYRVLLRQDSRRYTTHLGRLETSALRDRFMGTRYRELCSHSEWAWPNVKMGAFVQGELRGVGELLVSTRGKRDAELAFSVETPYRRHGIGTRLILSLMSFARNRRVQTLTLFCFATNPAMRRLAVKAGGRLEYEVGELVAKIDLGPAGPTSLAVEFLETTSAIHAGLCGGLKQGQATNAT